MAKSPIRIAVTGAAGQIAYALVFRIASGALLGHEQPVILNLLDLPNMQGVLKGVMMELEDCAFPALAGMTATDDAKVAFQDIDIAFLVGARPRSKGMERKDLLGTNAEIFTAQGRALNEAAKRSARILVVGNPANTNAYIAMKSAPDLSSDCFSAMIRLDHNRAVSMLAAKSASLTNPALRNATTITGIASRATRTDSAIASLVNPARSAPRTQRSMRLRRIRASPASLASNRARYAKA